MRNLRKAALVVAMVGTLGMAGAGVASATEYGNGNDNGTDGDSRTCVNVAEASNEHTGPNLVGLVGDVSLLSSTSQTNVIQQICSNGDNSPNEQTADGRTNQANVLFPLLSDLGL